MVTQNNWCCSLCGYTTNRKYNLQRHTISLHGSLLDENAQKPESVAQKPEPAAQKPESPLTKVFKCQSCFKVFQRNYHLQRHIPNCKQVQHPYECIMCHRVCASADALSHHRKVCKTIVVAEPETKDGGTHEQPTTVTNIQTQNNTNAHTINQNTINIINFPQDGDTNFAFLKDHIQSSHLESMFNRVRPDIGFRKYAHAILERKENRMIYKNNPNTRYCKIHRDGNWDHELDKEAFPVLTNHLSIGALEDVHAHREKLVRRTRIDVARILKYLDDVNTENDENSNFEDAMDRIKLIIINLSQRLGVPKDLDLDT
jgi:hypothetical protein